MSYFALHHREHSPPRRQPRRQSLLSDGQKSARLSSCWHRSELKTHTSDNPPQSGSRAVDASANPEPIQTQLSPCKSLAIVGIAVETPVRSKADKKREMQAERKINQNLPSRLGLSVGSSKLSVMIQGAQGVTQGCMSARLAAYLYSLARMHLQNEEREPRSATDGQSPLQTTATEAVESGRHTLKI